jgi:hypothetical protein
MKCFRCGRDEACEKRQEVHFDYRGFSLLICLASGECLDCGQKAGVDLFDWFDTRIPGFVTMKGKNLEVDWQAYLQACNLGGIDLPDGQILGDEHDFLVMLGVLSPHCHGNYEVIGRNDRPPHFSLKPRSRHSGLYFTERRYAQSYSDVMLGDYPGKKGIEKLVGFGKARLEYVGT